MHLCHRYSRDLETLEMNVPLSWIFQGSRNSRDVHTSVMDVLGCWSGALGLGLTYLCHGCFGLLIGDFGFGFVVPLSWMFWVADRGLGVWVCRTSVMDVLGCWSGAWGLGLSYLCHGCFGLLIRGLGFGLDVPLSWMFWVVDRGLGVWVWHTSVMDVVGCWSGALGFVLDVPLSWMFWVADRGLWIWVWRTSVMDVLDCWSGALGLVWTYLCHGCFGLLVVGLGLGFNSTSVMDVLGCWSGALGLGWTYLCHGCFGQLIGGLWFGLDVPLSWMFWAADRGLGVWVGCISVMDVFGSWLGALGLGLTYLCHGCFGLLVVGLGFGFDVPLSWLLWAADRGLGVWVLRTSVMDVLGCWSVAWGLGLRYLCHGCFGLLIVGLGFGLDVPLSWLLWAADRGLGVWV